MNEIIGRVAVRETRKGSTERSVMWVVLWIGLNPALDLWVLAARGPADAAA